MTGTGIRLKKDKAWISWKCWGRGKWDGGQIGGQIGGL